MGTQNDGLEHVSRILSNMAQPFLVSMSNFWGVDSWTLVVGGFNLFEKYERQLGSWNPKKNRGQKQNNKQKNAAKRNHHLPDHRVDFDRLGGGTANRYAPSYHIAVFCSSWVSAWEQVASWLLSWARPGNPWRTAEQQTTYENRPGTNRKHSISNPSIFRGELLLVSRRDLPKTNI